MILSVELSEDDYSKLSYMLCYENASDIKLSIKRANIKESPLVIEKLYVEVNK